MMRYSKRYFKKEIESRYGMNPTTAKMLTMVGVLIKDDERITWDEFFERFSFILK